MAEPLQFYNDHVASRIEAGMSEPALIAASITADNKRYPNAEYTLEQVAVALTSNLNTDPSGVVTRLVTSLQAYVGATGDVLVSHKLNRILDTDNPGTIDLGNYLQRQMLLHLAANESLTIEIADVNALLALVDVPPAVTEQEVTDALAAKAAQDVIDAQATADAIAKRDLRKGLEALQVIYDATANAEISPLFESETLPTNEELAVALEAQAAAVRAL